MEQTMTVKKCGQCAYNCKMEQTMTVKTCGQCAYKLQDGTDDDSEEVWIMCVQLQDGTDNESEEVWTMCVQTARWNRQWQRRRVDNVHTNCKMEQTMPVKKCGQCAYKLQDGIDNDSEDVWTMCIQTAR